MLPQTTRLLPRQITPDTLQQADTLALDDTLTLIDRLRADSSLYLTNPASEVRTMFRTLRENLLDPAIWFGLLGIAVRIVVVMLLAYFAIRIVDRVTRQWTQRFTELPAIHPRRQRAFTISHLISSTTRYVAWPIALIMILSEIGVDIGALIATAGIAGLAIGFGAQTLVKDVISGVFLLFDDSIHVGDVVRIGSDMGTVEHIGVRLIKVRKFDGELMMVPAGELRIFGNKSIGYARVIVEVRLPYEQDLETILPIMQRVANEWAETRRDILLEEAPQVQAITQFAESSVNTRIVVMVTPGEQWAAERELRILLKRAFDQLGIEIPFPRSTLYVRQGDERPPRSIVDPSLNAPSDTDAAGSD